jgi:hypothetical protein
MKNPAIKQTTVPISTDTLSISEIDRRLIDGDYKIIADVTGYSDTYVYKCMKEKRRNRLVVTVADQLVKNRDQFIKQMKAIAKLIREDKYPVAQ